MASGYKGSLISRPLNLGLIGSNLIKSTPLARTLAWGVEENWIKKEKDESIPEA